jgi:glucosamine-6-phosphate deaminase
MITRFERIPTDIFESANEGSRHIAKIIAKDIREKQAEGANYVIALPGGRTPRSLFKELIRMHRKEGLSFANVVVFNLYEYYPLASADFSNISFLKDHFLNHIDIAPENIFSPDGFMPKDEIFNVCMKYEQTIAECGGIDLVLLGIGHSGNIAVNTPGSALSSTTRFALLDDDSRKEMAQLFKYVDQVPAGVITMGVSTILGARQIILMAWGDSKSAIIREAVEGKQTNRTPASFLQDRPNAQAVIDLSAAYQLTRISHPWLVTECDWDDQLIRRAIVWLCNITGKPILKLTNVDYTNNGLGQLISRFASAYMVNLRIFNDIQQTITGWPGGKPGADDSNRPERALPHPKRVIIFSPHPDDDVISMGGTFQRLCEQEHEVWVAYQTSGNIAVADEEVIRYCEYLRDVSLKYSPDQPLLCKKAEEIIHYIKYEKKEDARERPDVLFMKGTIRREEAKAAARYSGIKDDSRIRFLDLPFYETGMVKKNDIGLADRDIVMQLLDEVRPHQIFVAGDLADPHGTHKMCLDVALAAIDELKNEPWMQDCRIWMYRGAWAEWEMDHIEMAVPISPEQLKRKRNAILRHQSQAESAPFLGNDERLFWQRAEDRNRATADLYRSLGLAAYEAIEAFVQYHPLQTAR